MSENQEQNQVNRKDLILDIIDRKDRVALHKWIELNFGLNIPEVAICKDHCAPFDFIADYIFGVVDFAIVVANRSGGKTMNFGVLDTTMSYTFDNAEIAAVGAIQAQAQKGYQYFKDFSSKYPFAPNIKTSSMNRTKLHNGSEVQILTGTMSGVNSPHPQFVFLDEIDLMIWPILQQALSMAQSKHGVDSRTVLTSTRKFTNGPMQRMISEANSRSAKVYMWCIWEVIEALPKDPEQLQLIRETFGNELPINIDKANGYYTWKDTIKKFKSLDRETWETEWICKRPGLKGVIYGSSYSDDENSLLDWSPEGKPGYIYLFEDFGYGEGHPDVCLFAWVPTTFDRLVIFDELYMEGLGTDDIWLQIDAKLAEYGHNLPNKQLNLQGTVRGWVPDYHGLTEIQDRSFRGAPMMPKKEDSELYIVNNGITLVNRMFASGRLMITNKCTNLRTEILSYKRKKNVDGTYSPVPEKKDDHGPDALRYGVIQLFSAIASQAFVDKEENPDVSEPEPKVEDRPWVPKVPIPTSKVNGTMTGAMVNDKGWR